MMVILLRLRFRGEYNENRREPCGLFVSQARAEHRTTAAKPSTKNTEKYFRARAAPAEGRLTALLSFSGVTLVLNRLLCVTLYVRGVRKAAMHNNYRGTIDCHVVSVFFIPSWCVLIFCYFDGYTYTHVCISSALLV